MNPQQQHLQRVREAMQARGIDLMFLNFGADFTYVTGLLTPDYYQGIRIYGDWITGVMFGVEQDPVLILQEDFALDRLSSTTWISDARVLPDGDDADAFLASVVADFAPAGKTIAVSKMLWGQTLLSLQAAAPGARFVANTDVLMDRVRSIKDDYELNLLRRAADITTQVQADTIANLHIGMTARDVKIELLGQMRRHPIQDISFSPGVLCVNPDSDPQRRKRDDAVLTPGSTLAFDFGVKYQGYCSDFGRSVFVGEPRPEALAAYRSITRIVQAVTARLSDGALTPVSAYHFARDMVIADGFNEGYYQWGLGHAIGLEVHEWPWLRPGYDDPLRAGMVLCVEPKVGKPGQFYVRCEDVILVGQHAGEPLTRFTYEPLVIS